MNGSKHEVITTIVSKLFAKEEGHLDKLEHEMIGRNVKLGGSQDGFRHMGRVYSLIAGPGRSRVKADRLHSDLTDEMNTILRDRETVAYDKRRISQALALSLRDCQDWQEIRDALPNGLKQFLPETAHLERTAKEAFTILNDSRAHEQYLRLREKIEYYVATQLLY